MTMFRLPFYGRYSAAAFLLLAAALPLCVSCQSRGYVPGPNDPFAENAPKTKEEEEYYRDVLSGDWKKQMTNPLGYFGLGRNQVSTTPPPHWMMEPPAGSKTMEDLRAEAYEKRIISEQAKHQQSAGPEGRVYKTAAVDTRLPDRAQPKQQAAPAAVPKENGEPKKAEENESKKLTGLFKPFFEEGTRFPPLGRTELLPAESGSENFSLSTGRETVIRAQSPENESGTRAGGVISTADAVESPLTVDPELAERWQNLGGLRVRDDEVPKDLPNDEYIIVGGDAGSEAFALPNWDVHNLEADETIAHFDTVSGQIKVEPSNRFIIYMPRFASVRQMVGPQSRSQNTRLGSMDQDMTPNEERSAEGVEFRSQEERTSSTRGETQIADMRASQPGGEIVSEEGLIEETQKVLTASANGMLREETVSDQVRLELAQGAAAAAAWGKTQGVTVHIDRVAAQGNITLQGAATIYSIKNDTKTSQLRLFKSASKQQAKPGELIEFVIRYENVGTEVIGNVTILDSLSARLQYVDDSAVSSKKADLLVKNNETGSLLLRLEVTDPLEPGDYGVLTFLCKVR